VRSHFWRDVKEEHDPTVELNKQLATLYGESVEGFDSNMILIDSWTDFIQAISTTDRYKVQQSIVAAARREKKKLVLVTETKSYPDELLNLNHSTDAILLLQKRRLENRMYREIVIEKMRSLPLVQDTFLFTLANGRFTYIPWYVHQYPAITIEREPIQDPSDKRISTGNQSLDELTSGGFERGGLNLLEINNLAAPYLETFYIPFLSNQLILGRPAIILLPEGWSPERFIDSLSHFIDRSVVRDQVVFFGRHALSKDSNMRSLDNDPWKTLQEFQYESGQLEREFKCEVTELLSIDTLENKYGDTTVKGMLAEISSALPDTRRAVIAILSHQQSIKSDALSPNQHLRVQEINGVMSICGVNPRTNFLAVRPILSKGYLDYELMPIL
jgi:hypothetical protein